MGTHATTSVATIATNSMFLAAATTDPAHHTITSHLGVTPATSKVWYILVDQNSMPVEKPSYVTLGHDGNVLDLKKKIKEGGHKEYLANFNIKDIVVWKCALLTLCGV